MWKKNAKIAKKNLQGRWQDRRFVGGWRCEQHRWHDHETKQRRGWGRCAQRRRKCYRWRRRSGGRGRWRWWSDLERCGGWRWGGRRESLEKVEEEGCRWWWAWCRWEHRCSGRSEGGLGGWRRPGKWRGGDRMGARLGLSPPCRVRGDERDDRRGRWSGCPALIGELSPLSCWGIPCMLPLFSKFKSF